MHAASSLTDISTEPPTHYSNDNWAQAIVDKVSEVPQMDLVGSLQSVLNEELSCSSIFGAFHKKNTTVASILFEKLLQSPAHLNRGAKLSDRAGIIQLKSTTLEQSYHIIQAPEVA